ncbi:efflux RND transporter permease subunit [Vreelandella sp. F11]|uniref:efflux RND transporter permease subunit n=1 Tax=Vreelandella sp. F11 TaxID=3394751 RepID=UPI0036DA2BD7
MGHASPIPCLQEACPAYRDDHSCHGADMVPIALGWAGDHSFRAPMALVVIGGLMTSTFLSLLVIPVFTVALMVL